MALSLTHTFVCGIADDAAAQAAGEILPSHWNAALTTSMATGKFLGRTTAGTGAIEELSLGTGVATFIATPSSANLRSAVTDETGTGGGLVFATAPTLTTPTLTGNIETKTAPAIASNELTLDCSAGNVFVVSLNANITTLSFSNVPATGNSYSLTLVLTADGTPRTVTWGASVAKWPGGTAPTLTSTNAKSDFFVLTTWDGGTTWYPTIAGQNR